MKDTDKDELTAEAAKRAAEKCGTAKEILKELFPEVFKVSEWEDVTSLAVLDDSTGYLAIGFKDSDDVPYTLTPNNDSVSMALGKYKIEGTHIWRRKSQ